MHSQISEIAQIFSRHGFTLRPSCIEYLQPMNIYDIESLVRDWKHVLKGPILEADNIRQAINLNSLRSSPHHNKANIQSKEIDLFSNMVVASEPSIGKIISSASSKNHLMDLRMQNIISKTSKKVLQAGSLQGKSNNSSITIIGVIFSVKGDEIVIEDSSSVKVRASIKFLADPTSFFTVGSIIVAEGVLNHNSNFEIKKIEIDNKYQILKGKEFIGKDLATFHSEDENIHNTSNKGGIANPYSTPTKQVNHIFSPFTVSARKNGMGELESIQNSILLKTDRAGVLLFSDFDLTNPSLFSNFEKVLAGMRKMKPAGFIFCGDFFPSNPLTTSMVDSDKIENASVNLNKVLLRNPDYLNDCFFVFIPSQNDPVLPIFPKDPLPHSIFTSLSQNMNKALNLSNPAKISIKNHSMLVLRTNTLKHLRRNTIKSPDPTLSNERVLINTILEQGYLSPTNIYNQPVCPEKDKSLIIEGLPEYFIIGDQFCKQYHENINGCNFIIPGSFSKKGSFYLIKPESNLIQPCEI